MDRIWTSWEVKILKKKKTRQWILMSLERLWEPDHHYLRMLIWTIAIGLFWRYFLPALIRILSEDLRLKKYSSYWTRSLRILKMKANLLLAFLRHPPLYR